MKTENTRRGFTLIELLVVVLIIGILAAIALPQYQKAVRKARAVEAITAVQTIAQAEEVFYLANGSYTDNLNNLDIQIPALKDWNNVAVYLYETASRIYTQKYDDVDDLDTETVIAYYLDSKRLVCMAWPGYEPAEQLCQSFPTSKEDCLGVDKEDGYDCYYFN